MIEVLKGNLLIHKPTHLVIENGNMGIGVDVPLTTSQQFSVVGKEVFLHTKLMVQMNARSGDTNLSLYGFAREVEKDVFTLLISISGIGPKGALRILSEKTPEDLSIIVKSDSIQELTKLKGIGQKTAEVLMPQLKNAFSKIELEDNISSTAFVGNLSSQEAILALISLGVKEANARKAVDKAVKVMGAESSSAELIPEALRYT